MDSPVLRRWLGTTNASLGGRGGGDRAKVLEPAQYKLASLHARLSALGRRRRAVRWGSAAAALALIAIWIPAAAMAVDWTFEMNRSQRLVVLGLAAGALVWAVRRFVVPWLGRDETELDLALLVEQRQQIDSDLVAALEFDSAEARRGSSRQLEGAVVDYVAAFSHGWNVFDGFSDQGLGRKLLALALSLTMLGVVTFLAPGHLGALADRFLLGSAHYPSRTRVDRLIVNGVEVDPCIGAPVRCPYGQSLRFEVHAAGELPERGEIAITATDGSAHTTVVLVREDHPKPGSQASASAVYRGQLPKLLDSAYYELLLGDAWTDPARVELIPIPVVETWLRVRTPVYAVEGAPPVRTTARQLAVIEGSRVDVEVQCANKRLTEVAMVIGDQRHRLQPAAGNLPGFRGKENGTGALDADRETAVAQSWVLDPADTPLACVTQPVHYVIQVTDEDGLQLDEPVKGSIRLRVDQRPRVTADALTRQVVPTAVPQIEYRVNDDHGLAWVVIHLEKLGEHREDPEPLPSIELLGRPLSRSQLPLAGTRALDLAPMKLVKGDRLRITVEAKDYRGELPGRFARSEPVVLDVMDENGILAAISEPDERSARQLDALINQELGIGAAP